MAIIISEVKSSSRELYPLTKNYPMALLPIGTKKLITYQLESLIPIQHIASTLLFTSRSSRRCHSLGQLFEALPRIAVFNQTSPISSPCLVFHSQRNQQYLRCSKGIAYQQQKWLQRIHPYPRWYSDRNPTDWSFKFSWEPGKLINLFAKG